MTPISSAHKAVILSAFAALLMSGTALAAPTGVGHELSVPAPEVSYPLPVVKNYIAQTGKSADGKDVNKFDRRHNPIIEILSGFDKIWMLGDEAWANGGANGGGAKDYSHTKIIDPVAWTHNMSYVLDVTGPARSDQHALEAYLDDRRRKGYSVLDGMGPLMPLYIKNSGVTTTLPYNLDNFDPNFVVPAKEKDKGNNAGTTDSPLGAFVAFMEMMRGPEGTTSRAKYFYASPRPWRMTDTGDVVPTGKETIGEKQFETHDSNVKMVPALLSARETRGRHKDGAFPSGHTNAAYVSSFAYAYAMPERFSELLTRASELGENRIVAGMHSPLDVIGGRIMGTAISAAYLNDPRFAEAKKAAYDNIHEVLSKDLNPGETLAERAQDGAFDRWANDAANKALYRQRMTYGFAQDKSKAGQDMIVPLGAEVLLETRQPYLTADQRRAVLYTTGIDSGYPVLDDSNGWGRLDLVAAADGYGAFLGDVTVDMDAAKGGFHAVDSWDNTISGAGMLTKKGSGQLTLTGDNSYTGGTILEDGTLVATKATSLGKGDLLVKGGTLVVPATGLTVGTADIEGGMLKVDFQGQTPATGTSFPVLTATKLSGNFAAVEASGVKVKGEVKNNILTITVL